MTQGQAQYIAGTWCDAAGGGRRDVIDPGTEEVVANVPFGGAADVVRAVDVAQQAFPAWRAMTAYERGAILANAAKLMRARAPQPAEITVREAGKPLPEAAG